jgi:hypothetical protein
MEQVAQNFLFREGEGNGDGDCEDDDDCGDDIKLTSNERDKMRVKTKIDFTADKSRSFGVDFRE